MTKTYLRAGLLAVGALALATACGRAGLPGGQAVAPGGAQAHLRHADVGLSPCDPEIAGHITLSGPKPKGKLIAAHAGAPGNPPKPAVVEFVSPNQNARPGGPDDITCIVLHHTASAASAEKIGQFFQDPKAQVSSHYVVGYDGAVIQCVNDTGRAWHAGRSTYNGRGNVNDYSIGIEICNVGDGKDPYPEAQYKALGQLMAFLMADRKVDWDHVTRHRDVATPLGRKNDTSDNFSRETLVKATQDAGWPPASPPPPAPPLVGLAGFHPGSAR